MKNEALIVDFYELTMANSYFEQKLFDKKVYFDYFFRNIPDNGGYAIFCGLDSLLKYLKNLRFTKSDIKYLRSKKIFSEGFLKYLENFKFTGKVFSFKEGSVIFPNEPIVTVYGNIIECQIIETYLLLCLNHQSLIATKAARIVKVAKNRTVMEFGARRAHSFDAAIYGARAAYIGGAIGTSNTICDKLYKIPALGTMAHSYVSMFDNEYDSFLAYAKDYPNNVVLLIDTYDTLRSGLPNAIKLYKEYLKPNKLKLHGVRIDSGDLGYLTKETRKILDKNGLKDTKIVVSNSLDEYLIKDLITNQEAPIDIFGVGERLITAKSDSIFNGVYKLVGVEDENKLIIPKIKVSNTIVKITTPSFKQVYRLYDQEKMAIADLVTLRNEIVNTDKYILFDPLEPWKEKEINNFIKKEMLNLVFDNGKILVNDSLTKIKKRVQKELKSMWPEIKRLENPHQYYVDLSKELYELKKQLIESKTNIKK